MEARACTAYEEAAGDVSNWEKKGSPSRSIFTAVDKNDGPVLFG